MKKPELLSPAGNMESLYAAIEGGCDAVYLAGNFYGARSFATNFTNEELKEAISYAHLYGVKVYITINTLIYETEIKNFLEYVEYLQEISVDAVIVQDIGMMDLLHQLYPSLEIHASTQMHIHNLEGVKLLEKLGIKRAVLARETPIELVSDIKKSTSLELEIFIHGALCISYSGQCLMSSLIGGRSGNRGTCAQCCRQPYDLYVDGKKKNQDQYLLSAKDLNTLPYIEELLKIGVDSLKIEGRMKRPEYVYFATSLYRKAIDSYFENGHILITSQEIEEMKKLFSRGFTKGFLFHEDYQSFTNEYRPNHMGIPIGKVTKQMSNMIEIELSAKLSVKDGIRILGKEDTGKVVDVLYLDNQKVKSAGKGDVVRIPYRDKVKIASLVVKTTDSEQLALLNAKIDGRTRKVPITMKLKAKVHEALELTIEDGERILTQKSDYIVEKSKNAPMTKNRMQEQLEKLGPTVYHLDEIIWDLEEGIFIPVQKLNELRRTLVEKLNEARRYKLPIKKGVYKRSVPHYESMKLRTVYVSSLEEYDKIKDKDYDEIYVDKKIYEKILDTKKVLKIPRVQEHLQPCSERVLVGELGSVSFYKDMVTDFSLNVVNSYSVAFLHSLGARRVTLSYELNDYQIEKLITAYRMRYQENPCLEMIVSGKIEAMISKYRLLSEYHMITNAYLVDKFANRFPVEEKDNLLYIYHYQNQQVEDPDHYYDLGVSSLRDAF